MLDVEDYLAFLVRQHEVLHQKVDHAGIQVNVHRCFHNTLHVFFVGVEALYVRIWVYFAFEGRWEIFGEEESDDLAGEGYVGGTESKDDKAICLDVI